MKLSRLIPSTIITISATLSAVLLGTLPSHGQAALGQRGFRCDTSSGVPITLYQNTQGGIEPWIRWTSNAFSGSGYDPLTRCQHVSARLETYRRNKQLKYLTVGIMNRQRVICTASRVNGRCEGLIYTLKRRQDAVKTLNNLLAWREGQAATPSLNESGQIPYIDVRPYLDEGTAPAAPTAAPPAARPQPQQPSSGGLREL